ncbi:MAG: hypothetical protein ACO3OX_03505, partial [Burkholderiaceae bacterium]
MLIEFAWILAKALFSLVCIASMLRAYLLWLRMPPMNPISQLVFRVTNWIVLRHLLPTNQKVVKHNSQSRNFVSERTTKMIAIDDKAYWIRDNRFFVAEIIDGKV